MRIILLMGCLALPCPDAAAATLKPYTALESGVVRLSDLFDGADDKPIGPGPLPGARIVVEAAQLGAIARMFGVDWRATGSERAILERQGRSLAREDVLPALREALLAAGAARDSEVDFVGLATPPLPLGTPPALEIDKLSLDMATGRFTAMLTAVVDGMAPVQARLSGRVQEMVSLPVPRRALMPGEVVGTADLQWVRMRAGLARGEVVRQMAQVEGQALRRAVAAGQPIMVGDLGRPLVVSKGMPLALELNGPGLQVTAQGIAAEAGGVGERIKVTNPVSRAVIEAEVTGPGRARVTPGPGSVQVAAR